MAIATTRTRCTNRFIDWGAARKQEMVEQLGIEAIHAQPAFLESPEWETLHEQGMKIRLYTINDSTECRAKRSMPS